MQFAVRVNTYGGESEDEHNNHGAYRNEGEGESNNENGTDGWDEDKDVEEREDEKKIKNEAS
ncbi:hypothetical protein HDU90_007607 [Geranomyces variabilis]|nr:hypothetical protein HDU90_007607 [Geranomyces variabilis]